MKENNASHFKTSSKAGAPSAVHQSSSCRELPEGHVLPECPLAPGTPGWPESPECPVGPESPGSPGSLVPPVSVGHQDEKALKMALKIFGGVMLPKRRAVPRKRCGSLPAI
jgi:hypothetical protein